MTSTDPERIQAVPTTDAEPPAATSVVTGPSQVPTSQADGRGRRSWGRRALIGLVLVATFTVGIGVGQVAPSFTADGSTAPTPSAEELALFKEAWDAIHTQYVGRADLDDKALIYGAINGLTEAVGDTGHTSFMTPEERAARNNALSGSYVGIGVRVDRDGRRASRRSSASSRTARPRPRASRSATSSSRWTAPRPRAATSTTS